MRDKAKKERGKEIEERIFVFFYKKFPKKNHGIQKERKKERKKTKTKAELTPINMTDDRLLIG